ISAYHGLKEQPPFSSIGEPRTNAAFAALAELYRATGQAEKAAALGNQRQAEVEAAQQREAEGYRQRAEKGDAEALNGLAWLLATSESAKIRDGKNAIAYAERAVAKTDRKEPNYLDTLAVA